MIIIPQEDDGSHSHAASAPARGARMPEPAASRSGLLAHLGAALLLLGATAAGLAMAPACAEAVSPPTGQIQAAPAEAGGDETDDHVVTAKDIVQLGAASWYRLPGRKTADGEHFRPTTLTAAHRWLPFGSIVRVTNLSNGRSVKVRINDRGPYHRGRIIDLTPRAAKALGMTHDGVVQVRLDVVHLSLASSSPHRGEEKTADNPG